MDFYALWSVVISSEQFIELNFRDLTSNNMHVFSATFNGFAIGKK